MMVPPIRDPLPMLEIPSKSFSDHQQAFLLQEGTWKDGWALPSLSSTLFCCQQEANAANALHPQRVECRVHFRKELKGF